jgi:hypothetical protein
MPENVAKSVQSAVPTVSSLSQPHMATPHDYEGVTREIATVTARSSAFTNWLNWRNRCR